MEAESSFSAYLKQEESGALTFGGARMVMLDVLSGFWGIRRQVEALVGTHLAGMVLQQAGANGGASFAQSLVGGKSEDPPGAFRDCLAAYQAAGFGRFEIQRMDPGLFTAEDPGGKRVIVRGQNNFEAWAADRHDAAGEPVCGYTSGVLVGFINVISGRGDLVCRETACKAAGGDGCTFELLRVEESDETAVVNYAPDPGLGRKVKLLELLFERMPMGIAILDPDYHIRRFNPTWHDFAKLYRDPDGKKLVPGVNYFEHLPDTESVVKDLFDRVLAGETLRETGIPLSTGGHTSYWDVVLAPIYEGQEVTGILNVTIDVTERVKSRLKLQETLDILQEREERLSLVMDGINDGVWDWDLLEDEVYYSPRWKEMLGYQDQELENRFETWQNLVHPEDLENTLQAVREYLEGERDTYYLEHRLKHKDGSYRWILARGKVLRSQEGVPYRMVGSHTDITERKRAKTRLEESRRRLSTLISNLPGMAYRCRNQPDWPMEFVSQGSVELTGYSPEELVTGAGPSYGDLIPETDREAIWGEVQDALESGSAYQLTYRIHTPQGEKWVWEQGQGVDHGSGEVTALEGFITDITERVEAQRNLEERVQERTRELSTLLDISHDLASTLDLGDLSGQILDQLGEVVEYYAASIMIKEDHTLRILAYRGPIDRERALQIAFPLEESRANAEVIRRKEPLIIDDIREDHPLAAAVRDTAGEEIDTTYSYLRCWMGVPLLVKDEVVGMLTLDSKDPCYYGPAEADIALAFANQVAVAVDNARLFSEVEQRADESETMLAVQQAIASRLDPENVLQLIADEARRLTNTDISAVYLLDDEELEISYVSGDVPSEIKGRRMSVEGSVAGLAVRQRRSILVQDTWEDERVNRSVADRVRARSLLIVPLISGEETIGTITVAKRTPGGYRAEDERVLNTLAANVVISLENARLYQAEQDRRQVAEGLRDILAVLNSERPLEQILSHVISQAVQLSSADAGVMYALVEESSLVGVVSEHGMPEAFPTASTFPLQDVPAHKAVLKREHFLVEDMGELRDPQGENLDPISTVVQRDFRSSMTIPVVVKEEIFGAITLYFRESQRFSRENVQLASSFADQAALAIENAELRSQAEKTAVAEERNRLARDLHDAVTQTLFSASLIAEVLPRIWEKDQEAGRQRLEELRELTRGALAEMRSLLMELRPKAVLEADFDELVEQLRNGFVGRTRIPLEYNLNVGGKPPDDVKVSLYRIIQESLNNIAKHARADLVRLEVEIQETRASLKIEDDGKGFDPSQIPPDSLGLGIMRERAQEINAELKIDSAPGEGTRVSVNWELAEEKNDV